MQLPDWLQQRVAGSPDALALSCGDVRLTWADLDREATTTAQRLRALGVGRGDRVAALLGNGASFVGVVHALIKLGAVLVPLNTRLTPAELIWQITDVRATVLLADQRNAEPVREIATALPDLRCVGVDDSSDPLLVAAIGAQPFDPTDQIDLDATQCIIYTSGTTGTPKGVMLTCGNHWWSATASALNLGLHADDRWLAVLPLFHVGGLAIVMRSVIYGIPVVIHERFDPQAVNADLDAGVSIISVVATMLGRMLDERSDRPYPPTLRAVLLGGGPAPRSLLERCAAIGVPVIQTYGMTETASQSATLAPADALRKLGSAGRPLLPVQIKIEHEGTIAAPNVVGEIVVRGPHVTPGYADRPDATAQTIRDGWLHTGDLGYLDDDGFLYVVDRRDDLIISGGENVYPAEVEAVLLTHAAVADAGVIGLPDPQWGQTVAAVVVPQPDQIVTPEALIALCGDRLARYKVPKQIIFAAALPRNASGKLLRRALRSNWRG